MSRVVLVTKGLDIGGVERVVVDLAASLSRHDQTVTVAVVNGRRRGLAPALAEEAPGVELADLGGSDRIGWRGWWGLVRLARRGDADVVHVHGPLPAAIVALVARGRPVVITLHTVWRGMRLPTRLLLRVAARRAAAVLAVSGAVAATLPGALGERVEVIPHGLDPERVRRVRSRPAAAAAAAGAAGSAGSEVVAVAVASHRDVKNYPNLLRALRLARERGAALRLVAVGEGERLADHRRLAAELGLGDAVRFEPPVPEVLDVIAAADMLVVASDYEGQPLVVAEALAMGRPVVATAVGRVPELVSPAVGRVVAPGDTEALAGALVELCADAELRARLGERAHEVWASWTLDDVVVAHLRVYERAGRARGRR